MTKNVRALILTQPQSEPTGQSYKASTVVKLRLDLASYNKQFSIQPTLELLLKIKDWPLMIVVGRHP